MAMLASVIFFILFRYFYKAVVDPYSPFLKLFLYVYF